MSAGMPSSPGCCEHLPRMSSSRSSSRALGGAQATTLSWLTGGVWCVLVTPRGVHPQIHGNMMLPGPLYSYRSSLRRYRASFHEAGCNAPDVSVLFVCVVSATEARCFLEHMPKIHRFG
ncbi:unnamed protein product [Ectocarpus sp. 13 AM-2016]